MNGRAKTNAEVHSPNSGPLCSLRVPVPKHVLSWEGHRWRAWRGFGTRCVCLPQNAPPPSRPPPHTPGAWGSELTLRPAGQGRPVPGGCALWPPPSPVLSGSVPALRSWWLAPDLHVTEGPEGRD